MLTAKDFRNEAWHKLSGNWGTMLAITVVFMLIEGALGYLSTYVVGAFAEILVLGPITLGLCMVSLNVIRKGQVEFATMFDGFKNFVNAFIAYLLVVLFTALWALLFIIPGIIKAYSYSMTMYILADHPELSGNEARLRSMELMNGNKWRLFCLHFSFIGWILLSILTFGILMLWVTPYMKTAEAAFYNSLVATEANNEAQSEAKADTQAESQDNSQSETQTEPLDPEVTKE